MGQDNGWLPECPGIPVVLTNPLGQRVEGFLEQVDAELGIAWIRDRATGERRMFTRADYPHTPCTVESKPRGATRAEMYPGSAGSSTV